MSNLTAQIFARDAVFRWQPTIFVATMIVAQWAIPLAVAQPTQTTLISKQNWVRFDLILGRLSAVHLRAGSVQSRKTSSDEMVSETITINEHAPSSRSIRYRQTNGNTAVELRFDNMNDLRFELKGDDHRVTFTQQPGQEVELTVRDGDRQEVHRFHSIWHLLLAEPKAARMHLLPLLQLLRPDWRLSDMAVQVESELFETAPGDTRATRERVQQLVKQLDSRSFSDRRRADKQLRGLGVAALPHLQSLSRADTTEEQRLRLQLIQEHLSGQTSDTPRRVGAWLANDRAIWFAILEHRDPKKRQVAAEQLNHTHGIRIEFDPFADESHREAQIAELRSRFVGY